MDQGRTKETNSDVNPWKTSNWFTVVSRSRDRLDSLPGIKTKSWIHEYTIYVYDLAVCNYSTCDSLRIAYYIILSQHFTAFKNAMFQQVQVTNGIQVFPKSSHQLEPQRRQPTNTSHLKMDGWKMKFPFLMAYFQVRSVSFGEGTCMFCTFTTICEGKRCSHY